MFIVGDGLIFLLLSHSAFAILVSKRKFCDFEFRFISEFPICETF